VAKGFLLIALRDFSMWNIIIGLVMIIGGLSGNLALRGTDSSGLLAALGGLLLAYGVYQVVSRREP
jgi:hypothetical protein